MSPRHLQLRDVTLLQRSAGNQAVQRLLQPSARVSAAPSGHPKHPAAALLRRLARLRPGAAER